MSGRHEAIAQLDSTMYSDSRRRVVGINTANKRLVVERRDGGVSTTRTESIRWVEVAGVQVDAQAYINYLLGVYPFPGQTPLPPPLMQPLAPKCYCNQAPTPFEAVYGYVVCGPGRATLIHGTRQQAESEAVRLAGDNHGVVFNVCPIKLSKAVSLASTPKPVAKLEKCDE